MPLSGYCIIQCRAARDSPFIDSSARYAKTGGMKRWLLVLAAVIAMAIPRPCHAQSTSESRRNAPYSDVEDSQALKIASYLLTPLGMGLEWGITRPLHDLATKSSVAPLLSGDNDGFYFGQTDNASKLPPQTFAPFRMPADPNELILDNGTTIRPDASTSSSMSYGEALPPVTTHVTSSASSPSAQLPPSSQPIMH